jgi:membrane-bound inhibitor of C-type lysozyme
MNRSSSQFLERGIMRSTRLFGVIAIFVITAFGSVIVSGQSTVNVRFRPGANSATLTGSIKGRRYIDYLVRARADQRMTVKLERRSGEPAYFNVVKQGGEVAIADDAIEVTEWTGDLPSDGTYAIRVYMGKAGRLAGRTSNFRISFTIDNGTESGSGAAVAGTKTVYYDCGGARLRADFKAGQVPTVRIRFGTQDIELPLEPSASGSKYEFNNQSFWVKGNEAALRSKVLDSTCRVTR